MKKIYLFIFLLTTATLCCNAQFKQGDFEIGFSLGLGNISNTQESDNNDIIKDDSQTQNFLAFNIIPAYFIIDGLSFEPEIGYTAMQEVNPSFSLIGNISYTYRIPDQNFAPFIRIGYGLSNSINIMPGDKRLFNGSDELDIGILNGGFGIKFLIENSATLRIEVNYRTYYQTRDEGAYSGDNKREYSYRFISLMLGFSILL